MSSDNALELLIEQRFELLTRLIELTDQQDAAIAAGHMSELMNVLGQKQRYLELMAQQTKQLRTAREQLQGSSSISVSTRSLQQQCDRMHEQLLAREAESELHLSQRRDELANHMSQSQTARTAAQRYSQDSHPGSSLSAEC